MAEQTEAQTEQPEQLDLDAELEAMRQAEQEAAPEPEPTPEPEPAPEPEPQVEPQPDNTVPLGVFREVRDELKATKSLNTDLQGTVKELSERLSRFEENLNPPPSFEDDPLGNLQHQTTQKFDKLSGDIGELKRAIEGNSEQTQVYNLQTRIQEAERQFTQEHPDYPKAFQHIKDQRLRQYEILGLDASNWDQEAASYIQTAIQSGRNPAEMVYDLAKQMGYQSEAPTTVVEETPEPKPEPKSLKEQAQKIQAAKSLSGASGSQPKGDIQDMEAADIDNLSDDEFDKLFVGQDSEKNWRKLHN